MCRLFTPALSAQRSANCFKHYTAQHFHHGTPIKLRDKTKPRRSPKRDVEGAVPYNYVLLCHTAKLFRSLRTLPSAGNNKSGADKHFDTTLYHKITLQFFFYYSAPLNRLTPNEALPQTPLGALPLDPTSPLAPGLTLRFIARFARYWLPHSVRRCHSSLLTPHLDCSTVS